MNELTAPLVDIEDNKKHIFIHHYADIRELLQQMKKTKSYIENT